MKRSRNVLIFYIFPVLSTAIIILAGCSPRKLMVSEFVAMVQAGLPAVEQEDDLHLLARSMPAHIKLLDLFNVRSCPIIDTCQNPAI